MDLATMRENGARSVWLYCDCGHHVSVNAKFAAALASEWQQIKRN